MGTEVSPRHETHSSWEAGGRHAADAAVKFIVDAHLDLAMNALEWNRDLRLPVPVLRQREHGLRDRPDRGRGTVSFPALRAGNVGLVVATQIARFIQGPSPVPGGWHSPEQAWAQTQGQRAWYRAMEEAGELRPITDLASLEAHLAAWDNAAAGAPQPIGYMLSLEGADSVLDLDKLATAHAQGLRAVGPAHYGPGVYANGTDATGGLNARGRELLRAMDALGIILDATHLCDDAFWDALEIFEGPVWASHNNCRALVNHNRQFSDEQLQALIARGAVIGGAFDAWMLVPGWERGVSEPAAMGCTLEKVVDHIDHVCQLAGNTLHAGIGTDLDGAFGTEQGPCDLDTIADLQRLPALFAARGYSDADVDNILHGNFLRFLRRAWGRGAQASAESAAAATSA